MARGLPDVPDKYKRKGVFTAKWGGKPCGLCDEKIETGDECQYYEDEICHLDCIS